MLAMSQLGQIRLSEPPKKSSLLPQQRKNDAPCPSGQRSICYSRNAPPLRASLISSRRMLCLLMVFCSCAKAWDGLKS